MVALTIEGGEKAKGGLWALSPNDHSIGKVTQATHGPVGACSLSFAGICKSMFGVKYMNRGCILMFLSCYVWVYGNKPLSFGKGIFFFLRIKVNWGE